VSIDGDAQADGSLTKPYGSLPDAVEAVRALRKAGNTEPAVITLREGRHQLNQTLVLGIEDGSPTTSGAVTLDQYGAGDTTGPAFLTFAAYPGEHPVVSAGVPVAGWKRLESAPSELPAKAVGKVWVADMPSGMDRFYTLYDSRGRLNRARNAGFAYTKPGNRRTLHFPEGALKNWDNLEDVEVQVRPSRVWVINMLPLASVDEANAVAQTAVSATYGMGPLPAYVHNPSGATVWVENILEALDEPGEWVVNTKTRKIYLWPSDPAPNGSPRGIMAPNTSELIRVEGAIDYDGPTDTPVRGIAFSGLTFSHADRRAWTSDENRLGWGMQHDWDMFDRPTALLRFRGAEDCRVTACRFINSGGTGLRLDLHAQRNRIVDCEFAHLGEAGILLAGYGPGTKDANHHNNIVNNLIHHFSEITWHSPGIWAWQSGHNRIAHNELHHSGYAAVLITTRVTPDRSLTGEGGRTVRRHEIAKEGGDRARGGYASWRRREKYNHSRHNLFEYNEISHSVQLLSDGNAIYLSGAGTGNIIRYNYVHDNLAHSLPAAIRCDDDQHETLIYGNVFYNNYGFAAGIASKGVNDIINNFIVAPVAAPRWGYISFEWAPVTGSKAQHNIIISHPEGGNAYAERLRGENRTGGGGPKLVETDMDSNLYYHPTDSHWMDEHLLKMRAVGKEKASLFGDPLFVDPEGGDFSFRPGSPALALGIEALDVSKMGRLSYALTGRVTDASGQGVPDATVFLVNRSNSGDYFETRTDSKGNYGVNVSEGLAKDASMSKAKSFDVYITGKGVYPYQERGVVFASEDHRDFVVQATDIWDNNRIVLRGSLNNSRFQFSQGTGRVAFMGGSITNMPGWRNSVENYLKQTFPETKFEFIEAGIPSLGSLYHSFRYQRDIVTKGQVDLLFLESAVNDGDKYNRTNNTVRTRAHEGILRQARLANPEVDIVQMHFLHEGYYNSDYDKDELLRRA